MHAWIAPLFSLCLLAPPAPGWLGVYLDGEAEAAVVTEVIPDSPAAKAGLEKGDVLLAVGDRATPTREAFVEAIRALEAGARVPVKLRRGEREQLFVVRLGERPDAGGAGAGGARPPAPPSAGGRPARPAPAVESKPAQGAGQGYLGIGLRETERGVVVDRVLPDGPAAGVDLQGGDLLSRVGGKRVGSLADLDSVLEGLRPGQRLEIQVESGGGTKSVALTVGTRPGVARERLPAPARPVSPPPPPATEAEVESVEVEVRAVEVVKPPPPPPAAESRPARAPRGARIARPESAPRSEVAPESPMPARGRVARPPSGDELERELEALRRELAELRRMLEELRKKGGE